MPVQLVKAKQLIAVLGKCSARVSKTEAGRVGRLQAEKIGVLPLLLKPSWFVEGMPYSLSQDPRPALAEPFEGYRRSFINWYADVGKERLWAEAEKL